MAHLYNEHSRTQLEMLALNIFPQYSVDEFLAYMKQYRGGDHLYAVDQGQAVSRAYGLQSLGVTVLIDQDGNIAGKTFPPGLAYEDLKAAVTQLLR